jgi:hypothetical protein
MDEHVPRAITTGLRFRGIDVLTVQEDSRSGFPDVVLLDRAAELGRVMFSQDQDFLIEAQSRQQSGRSFSGVIFARQSRISIGDCIRDLELIAQWGEPEDFANQVQFLPL